LYSLFCLLFAYSLVFFIRDYRTSAGRNNFSRLYLVNLLGHMLVRHIDALHGTHCLVVARIELEPTEASLHLQLAQSVFHLLHNQSTARNCSVVPVDFNGVQNCPDGQLLCVPVA
jgi:hypothetical protein